MDNPLRALIITTMKTYTAVLILIVMDNPLRENKDYGTCYKFQFVLILIVMDNPLRDV